MPTLACVCALLLAQSAGGENRGASFAAPDDFAELVQPAAAFDADARPGLGGSAPSSSSLSPFCASTMRRLQSSAPATAWPPPCPLPPGALRRAFEAGGAMPITRDFCLAERHEGGEPVVWTEAFLNAYGARVAAGAEGGSYTVAHVAQVRAAVRAAAAALGGVRHALVIGTDRPWIEVLLLAEGAARVTTFEYGDIISHHPRVAAKPYRALAADVLGPEVAHSALARWMLGAWPIRPDWADAFRGVVHADGTVRAQVIDPADPEQSWLAQLLDILWQEHGIAGLLNTSFNARGEPILQRHDDAVPLARRLGLDGVVVHGSLHRP